MGDWNDGYEQGMLDAKQDNMKGYFVGPIPDTGSYVNDYTEGYIKGYNFWIDDIDDL